MFGTTQEVFDGTPIDLENINIISEGEIEYDSSQIKILQNTRLLIKMSEVQLFSPGDSKEIDKIPKIFFDKKNLVIIKNLDDNKCLLWCFIRKHLNPVNLNVSRINKKDIEISEELIEEHNIDFENISINEIHKIEDLLECNIYVFGCNEKLENKKIIRKSLKNYDKDLDLLLINEINHYILIKNLNIFIGNNSHIVKSCRNCMNVFYSESKYNFHTEYCQTRKPQKLLPSFKKICFLKI